MRRKQKMMFCWEESAHEMCANVRYCFWALVYFKCVSSSGNKVTRVRLTSRPSIPVCDGFSVSQQPVQSGADRADRAVVRLGFLDFPALSPFYTLLDSWSVLNVLDLPDPNQNQTKKKTLPSALMINRDGKETLKKEKWRWKNTKCFLVLDAVCNKAHTRCSTAHKLRERRL